VTLKISAANALIVYPCNNAAKMFCKGPRPGRVAVPDAILCTRTLRLEFRAVGDRGCQGYHGRHKHKAWDENREGKAGHDSSTQVGMPTPGGQQQDRRPRGK
jgi:hypothetical protein